MQQHHPHLQGITPVCLSVNHLHDVFANRLATLITITPVIRRTHTILADIKVLGVVDVFVRPRLDAVDDLPTTSMFSIRVSSSKARGETYSRFQVYQDRSRDVSCIVTLVVEHVLAVAALGRKLLEVAISSDSMLLAELLPELASNYVAMLAVLSQDHFHAPIRSSVVAWGGKD